jgi:hypothetical protein
MADKPPYFKLGPFSARCGPGKRSRYSDWLAAGRSGDRNPVEAKFSAPFQTSRGAHAASYTMGTGSFLGVKLPGCGVNRTPSIAEVKERVELCNCTLSVLLHGRPQGELCRLPFTWPAACEPGALLLRPNGEGQCNIMVMRNITYYISTLLYNITYYIIIVL